MSESSLKRLFCVDYRLLSKTQLSKTLLNSRAMTSFGVIIASNASLPQIPVSLTVLINESGLYSTLQ